MSRQAWWPLTLLIGCAQSATEAKTPDEPTVGDWDPASEQDLRAFIHHVFATLNEGDAAAFRATIASDGFLGAYDYEGMTPSKKATPEEEAALVENAFATAKSNNAKVTHTPGDVECRATRVFGVCVLDFTSQVSLPDNQSVVYSFRSTATVRKGESGWQWTHWHTSFAKWPEMTTTVTPTPTAPIAAKYSTISLNPKDLKWQQVPDAPPGFKAAVVWGDPRNGPSASFVELPRKLTIPRHYHSANTWVLVVKGAIRVSTADGRLIDLEEGGYGLLPAKTIHTTNSKDGVVMFEMLDAADDIVFVDEAGVPAPPTVAPRPLPPATPQNQGQKK